MKGSQLKRSEIMLTNRTEETPKSYTGIYSMHKYWSKKPFNVIHKYIQTYTKPNDIVLDPFLGSGISSIESVFLDRRTVGIDINPMSTFITKQMLENTDPQIIEDEFLKIRNILHKRIDNLYQIIMDDKSFTGSHFIYKNERLVEIWYKDNKTKKIVDMTKPINVKTMKNFTCKNIKSVLPTKKLIKNSRINVKEGMSVYDLFTPRNALALSMLLEEINKIQDIELKDFFRFCFTACSGQASKMVFVINNRKKMKGEHTVSKRKEVGSWVIGYWIPKEHFEINAWNCFENRYKKILKAKKEFFQSKLNVKYVKNFKGIENNQGNILLINDSCYTALLKLPDNSIDYVITDPPHGDRLPYLELSMMWNDWLGFDVNMDNELVVSDAKTRDKTVTEYMVLLEKILVEINRVLKNTKYFTLMFNNYDQQVWRKLQEILFGLDLELSDVSTIGYSASSVVQDSRKGGLKTDFIFTFKKNISIRNKTFGIADKNIIDDLISDYLNKNKDHSLYKILNYVIIYLISNRLIFDIKSVISSISLKFQ